ncbi:MAG: rane protein [Deltaproteobacteria bacterium]|jgi:CBS-domain-containing membrane protein|nr:rane protein [Deltaproteobacteria bacterium]
MVTTRKECAISDDDLRAALKEMGTYVDVTEEDLKKIYSIALKHAEERLASRIAVGDVMTKKVITARADADIHELSALLSKNRISGLPVVDEENHVIGVVSEADILFMAGMERGHTFKDVLRHILGEPLPKRTHGNRINDIMSSPAITTRPEADIKEVAGILESKKIKRLPVVDSENRLLGIISRADLVGAMSRR